MSKIVLSFLLAANFLFANVEYFDSIYKNILIKNSEALVKNAQNMKISISSQNSDDAKKNLINLIISWKKVEAFYLLGEFDSNFIDIPRYIDFYRQGNENLQLQLDDIIKSSDGVQIALFKNSFKSINALEYIVSKYDLKDKRSSEIATAIIDNLATYFKQIEDGYKNKNYENIFISDEIKSNAMILNSLIETTYKLKEWRIGDVVGMSKKYKDDPSLERGEYYISENSLKAVKAILEQTKELIGKQNFKNYGDLLRSYEASKELDVSLKLINDSLDIVNTLKEDEFLNSKKLYQLTNELYINYYISLISKLKVKAKVVDADGD